ncbi:MAG: GGDEF domain-containing protein [Acidimicrobiales bacterium]
MGPPEQDDEGGATSRRHTAIAFRRSLVALGDALRSTADRADMVSALLRYGAEYLGTPVAIYFATVTGTSSLRPTDRVGATAASREVVSGHGLAVPVRPGGQLQGVVAFYGRPEAEPFSPDDVESLAILVRQTETAIDTAYVREEAMRLSLTDGLTGLWNRRHLDLALESELSRSVRFGEPFSVLFCDIDDFKAINDARGHQAGDAVLVELGRRLVDATREVDVVTRFGGDEFTLLLPRTGTAGALQLAAKIREAVSGPGIRLDPGELHVTISIGVATAPEHGSSGKELVAAADAALYRAKRGGGDRVERASVGMSSGGGP